MWRIGPTAGLALLSSLTPLTACQFDRPADVLAPDALVIDAIDAPPPCVADTIVCDDAHGIYTECAPDGSVTRRIDCPLGCAPDAELCLDIDPHNGLAKYLDTVADPPDVVFEGPTTIDAETGVILDNGVGVTLPMFLPQLRVFVVDSLVIRGDLTVPPASSYTESIAIVSRGDIEVMGRIDISAGGRVPGPGGRHSGDPSDFIECRGGDGLPAPPNASAGAGGGGAATAGGNGGRINGMEGMPGGPADTTIEPLFGGCQGGHLYYGTNNTAWGGSGGGSLQLVSRTAIRFTANGGIDASGGGGQPAQSYMGGSGGGAGGRIVLEAPQVILDGPAVVLSTKGGGGSGASGAAPGQPGADGGTSATPAAGGTSPIGSPGGAGGVTGAPQAGGDAGGAGASGGGGGGAPGTVAVFTTVGAIQPVNGATIRGVLVTAPLRTRRIPP